MDYKEKYEQAVLRMNKWVEGSEITDPKEVAEFVFPELKENEDEKIRKEIIEFICWAVDRGSITDKQRVKSNLWVAWLKKQGEKVDVIKNFNTEFERQISHLIASTINKEHEYNEGFVKWAANVLLNYAKHELEKQGEQNPLDNVEPKFKVGDWVVNEEMGTIHQIKELIENVTNKAYGYELTDGRYISTSKVDKYHLWTIQDAKDGDVIFSNDGHGSDSIELIKSVYDKYINFWFCLSSKNNFKDYYYEVYNGNIPYTNFASRKDATPATRKQRDLLFAKMKEAGYEWDADKKELKKIEQKPAWSEIDFSILDSIICVVEEWEDSQSEEEKKYYGASTKSDWLKSLKNRVQPQPKQEWSEEDERIFTLCAVSVKTRYNDGLLTHYEYELASLWLESIKERMKGE